MYKSKQSRYLPYSTNPSSGNTTNENAADLQSPEGNDDATTYTRHYKPRLIQSSRNDETLQDNASSMQLQIVAAYSCTPKNFDDTADCILPTMKCEDNSMEEQTEEYSIYEEKDESQMEDGNVTSSRKRRHRTNWTMKDELLLLSLWSQRARELQRVKRNMYIYEEIALEMDSKYSVKEVYSKISNMLQRYRKEKKELVLSKESNSSWIHFDALHQIVEAQLEAHIPATFESFSMDTSSSTPHLLNAKSECPSISETPVHEQTPTPPPETSTLLSPLKESSERNDNNIMELVKLAKEQNELTKTMMAESKKMSIRLVNIIERENNATIEFINLMKTVLEKM